MKKAIFLALSISLFSSSLYSASSAHAATVKSYNLDISSIDVSQIKDPQEKAAFEKFKQMLESEDAKKLIDGLKAYRDYYQVDSNGYYFVKEADKYIPADVYKLMSETFESANEELNKPEAKKVKQKSSSKVEGPVYYPDPGETTKYYGYHSKTYYFQGSNWDVGDWLYLSDEDTRWVVNVLIASTVFSYVLGKVLSLFPQTKGLALSADVITFMCGAGAAYLSNKNEGKGIYIRAYSGGIYCRAR